MPTARGIAPGNGSLVQAIRYATGAEPIIAGKPERALFDETIERMGGERPLMVGDRLDTDIDGAINAGIDSLAVLTGVSTLRDVMRRRSGHRPTYRLRRSRRPPRVASARSTIDGDTAPVRRRDGRARRRHRS